MQLKDKRTPTNVELDTYNKLLELTNYSMSVCKPKQKKDKNGVLHDNNHHVPQRYCKVGEYIVNTLFDVGAIVLETNNYYIGSNLNQEERLNNFNNRIKLQTIAIAKTYRIEHCIRVLHFHKPFADSTISYWIFLLSETRKALISWKDSTVRKRTGIK